MQNLNLCTRTHQALVPSLPVRGVWGTRSIRAQGPRLLQLPDRRLLSPDVNGELRGRQHSCLTELINERSNPFDKLCTPSTRRPNFILFCTLLPIHCVCQSQVAKQHVQCKDVYRFSDALASLALIIVTDSPKLEISFFWRTETRDWHKPSF